MSLVDNLEELNPSLNDELEALKATEEHEPDFQIDGQNLILTTRISPLTASDLAKQFVGLNLKITVDKNLYPDTQGPGNIEIFQVRGLDENQVEDLLKLLKDRCQEYDKCPVLYELLFTCKDYLTENNRPSDTCPICLFKIVQEDSFVKTPCFHYFHSFCFGQYLVKYQPISDEFEDDFSNMEQRLNKPKKLDENVLPCPVCREENISKKQWNIEQLLAEKLINEESTTFVKSKSLEELQQRMNYLLDCQQNKVKQVLLDEQQS